MKKLFNVFLMFSFICILAGCSKNKEASYSRYVPEAHFLFSVDPSANKVWRESIEDITVGSQFWIRVEVQVKTGVLTKILRNGSSGLNRIPVTVTIPNTEILEFNVMDAPSHIEGREDIVNNGRFYTFYAFADTNPKKVYVVFRCKALKVGAQKFNVSYGTQVNSNHSQFHIVTYVDSVEK